MSTLLKTITLAALLALAATGCKHGSADGKAVPPTSEVHDKTAPPATPDPATVEKAGEGDKASADKKEDGEKKGDEAKAGDTAPKADDTAPKADEEKKGDEQAP
jgi:hypothetical protein